VTDADLSTAVICALTGARLAVSGDLHATLAGAGWDRAAVLGHARAVLAAGGVWPHPVPDDLRLRVGSAQLMAAVRQAQGDLQLLGQPAGTAVPRALNADERRLLQDVPPHHGS